MTLLLLCYKPAQYNQCTTLKSTVTFTDVRMFIKWTVFFSNIYLKTKEMSQTWRTFIDCFTISALCIWQKVCVHKNKTLERNLLTQVQVQIMYSVGLNYCKEKRQNKFVLGLTSLSTHFRSYQDGVCLYQRVW